MDRNDDIVHGPTSQRVVEQFPLTHCFGIGQKSKIFLLCCAKGFHKDPTNNLPYF